MSKSKAGPEGAVYLDFQGLHDGVKDYVEVPGNSDGFSVVHADGSEHGLTVAASFKPATLIFATTEDIHGGDLSKRYVHWLGKGESNKQEWTFRIYSADNNLGRENRISFYVFNPAGGFGIGSHFQDSIDASEEWIQVVGVVDTVDQITRIYKNGVLRDVDNCKGEMGPLYGGVFENLPVSTMTRNGVPVVISPQHSDAPLRMGSKDRTSLLQGGLQGVRIWNRPLSTTEIAGLYEGHVPASNLVAQYLLNADTGTVAVDSAGSHNGSIVGASWQTKWRAAWPPDCGRAI
jgi:hypothetical protein